MKIQIDSFNAAPLLCLVPDLQSELNDKSYLELQSLQAAFFSRLEVVEQSISHARASQDRELEHSLSTEAHMLRQILDWCSASEG